MAGVVDRLADDLAGAGVRHAFGVTGSGASFALISALAERGVDYHAAQTEAAAVLMAGACGHDGRLRAASITIKGPGFANALPGLLANRAEQRPMVSVSEAYGAGVPDWRRHKRLDHAVLAASAVKGYAMAGVAVPEMLAHASAQPPGPVHVDLSAEPGTAAQFFAPDAAGGTASGDIDALLRRVAEAARPALVLGAGVKGLGVMAERWNRLTIPVATSAAAKGCFDEESGWHAGVITGETGRFSPEATILAEADLIVALNLGNEEVVSPGGFAAPLVMLGLDGAGALAGFGAEIAVGAGEPGDARAVLDALAGKDWGAARLAELREERQAFLGASGWQHAQALEQLQQAAPPGAVLVPDTGYHCSVAETLWRARSPDAFLGSSRSRHMGLAIPSAIGRAIAEPGRAVVCVFGDGGLPPHICEIALAVRLQLPILFAYFSDARYGSVAASVQGAAVAAATGFDTAARWRMISALGCEAAAVADGAALDAALAGWQPEAGPLFLQCDFEPEAYARLAQALR